jgi:hypothetical protein
MSNICQAFFTLSVAKCVAQVSLFNTILVLERQCKELTSNSQKVICVLLPIVNSKGQVDCFCECYEGIRGIGVITPLVLNMGRDIAQ